MSEGLLAHLKKRPYLNDFPDMAKRKQLEKHVEDWVEWFETHEKLVLGLKKQIEELLKEFQETMQEQSYNLSPSNSDVNMFVVDYGEILKESTYLSAKVLALVGKPEEIRDELRKRIKQNQKNKNRSS